MNEQIEQAIYDLRSNAARYGKSERYYSGDHDLAFASEKFENAFGAMFREFALNLCPAVCDSLRDKLIIKRFGVDGPADDLEGTAEALRRIWQLNRMATRSAKIHNEAVKNGDAYAVVWPDAQGKPAIYPHRGSSCAAGYDDENPDKIIWAAKHWKTRDKRTRLNLLFADRIERYISAKPTESVLPEAKSFVPYAGEDGGPPVIHNPYGVVPVFHFANNPGIGIFGRSELDPAIPIQDGLNKCVLDMLVAMEFSAFRQRWVTGIEVKYDSAGQAIPPFKAGVDRIWVAGKEDTRFGEFGAADLEQFLKVKDSFRVDIASVTGTPLHYLLPYTDAFPSGEALRKAETRFVSKVRARQEAFGQTWANLMSLALQIAGRGQGIRLVTEWEDPAPYSARETLENIRIKKELGISTAQALLEAGYADGDIKAMTE